MGRKWGGKSRSAKRKEQKAKGAFHLRTAALEAKGARSIAHSAKRKAQKAKGALR